MTSVAVTNLTILALLVVVPFGGSLAFAQVGVPIDSGLELFRVRCQIDADQNLVTGLMVPKVQIQGKARAGLLDGQIVDFQVKNNHVVGLASSVVSTVFELGSASADWDTFPDPLDPTPAELIRGDFAAEPNQIEVTAVVRSTGQSVSGVGTCMDKTASQFHQ